jgi:hypothetical protein
MTIHHAVFGLLVSATLFTFPAISRGGPYAPAAGQVGSTAISKDDSSLVGWATGYQDYLAGANVAPQWQMPAEALGPAGSSTTDIVTLGDGGQITLTFAQPIINGVGSDFAVFENSFSDVFLELAYVEVSSNGTDFFRFANDSKTENPVSAFGSIDPTNLDGLAGKYRHGWGTPFDLEQLLGVSPLLDLSNVNYVRIVDIIGDGSSLDSTGDVIYDPYPGSGSAGFDLDAVGVINAVPEPSTLALMGIASAWFVLVGCRRCRRLGTR